MSNDQLLTRSLVITIFRATELLLQRTVVVADQVSRVGCLAGYRARERLAAGRPAANIVVRDLVAAPLPHINEFAVARDLPPDELTPAQRETLRLSDALVKELMESGIAVSAPP